MLVPPPIRTLALVVLTLPWVGCAAPVGDLVLGEDWGLVPPSDDPVEGRPTDATACPQRTTAVEAGALEVDTSICGWVTVEAPARFRLRRGRELELFVFHRALTAPEPAEAVMGVQIGQDAPWTWSETVPVPSRDAFYEEVLVMDETIEEGDPIIFHVHNHGANTYTLGHLRAP